MNRLLTSLIMLIFMSSCSIFKHHKKRKISSKFPTNTTITIKDTLKSQEAKIDTTTTVKIDTLQWLQKKYEPLYNHTKAFTTFNGKSKVHYEGKGTKQDLSTHIKIQNKQKIWISITALGLVEVARAYFTPDTVLAIDRIHHQYIKFPFSEVEKLTGTPLDFITLQSLLMGEIVPFKTTPTFFKDTNNMINIIALTTQLIHSILINKSDSSLHFQTINQFGKGLIQLTYSDYKSEGGVNFPHDISIGINDNKAPILIDIDWGNIDFDQEQEYPFSIPNSYKQKF